jgi:hypothetical protein
MNNSQIRVLVRQLIVEAKEAKAKTAKIKTKKKISVSDHIKMIDEAGDKAATEAKTTEVTKMIQAVERIKKTISELEHFDKIVGVATIKSLNSDLDKSLAELNKKKDELEKTPSDKKKETVDEKLKPSMGAGAYVKDFKKSDAPQFQGKSKAKKQDMAIAAYLSAKK